MGLDYFETLRHERFSDTRLKLSWNLLLNDKPLFLRTRCIRRLLLDSGRAKDRFSAVVVHCFTGNEQALKLPRSRLLRWHYGWVCDERRGQRLLPLLDLIPENRLLIETDAPYLPRVSNRNRKVVGANQNTWSRYADL